MKLHKKKKKKTMKDIVEELYNMIPSSFDSKIIEKIMFICSVDAILNVHSSYITFIHYLLYM